MWVKNPPLASRSCWIRCPYEGDYFGQNMRTVHWKMRAASLKYNSCWPHEKSKKEQKDFVPQRGVFLVWWHYGCRNHYNETLFLLEKKIICLHRSGLDCTVSFHSETRLTTIIVTAASLERVRVKLQSSRVTGFLWPELLYRNTDHGVSEQKTKSVC